jgi:hypothetical protein
MKTVHLKDNMDIATASHHGATLKDGTKLVVGQRIKLPPAAGGKMGKVDSLFMEFNPSTLVAELNLRLVDDDGKGHVFKFEV